MFCIACASHNPPAVAHCTACGAPIRQCEYPTIPAWRMSRLRRARAPRLLAIVPLLAAVFAVVLGLRAYQSDRSALASAYARGEAAFAAGDYSAAASAYNEAGSYRDAAARRTEIMAELQLVQDRYLRGVAAVEGGRFEEAIDELTGVLREAPGYANAVTLLHEARTKQLAILRSEADHATQQHDWVEADRALTAMLAIDPEDREIAGRLATLRQTHSLILYTREGKIFTVGPDMADERLVLDKGKALLPSWSPDRTMIAFYTHLADPKDGLGLMVVNSDGTGLREVANHVAIDRWPAWSPDGARIAYIQLQGFELAGQRGVTSLNVVNVFDGSRRDLTNTHFPYVVSPSWSPDGEEVAFVSRDIFSRSGYRQAEHNEVYAVSIASGAIREIGKGRVTHAESVTWSPRGNQVLVYSVAPAPVGNESGDTTLQLVDSRTGTVTELSGWPDPIGYPFWSPDGSRFAFVEGGAIVHLMSLDGTEMWFNLSRAVTAFLSWSPDGSRLLAATSNPLESSMLITVDQGAQTDVAIRYDLSGAYLGPPQWSSPTAPVAPRLASIAGAGLDEDE